MANYLTGPHVYLVSQLFGDSFAVTEPACLRRNNNGILRVFENKTLWKFSKEDQMGRKILRKSVTECPIFTIWAAVNGKYTRGEGGLIGRVQNLAENSGKQPLEAPKAWDNITTGTGENM